MTWTPEHRRRYAPAIDHTVRTHAITRLAATIDAIDPPCGTGRPRLWSTLVMLQALWWLCRAGAAWRLLPEIYPPRQSIGSRLERWVKLKVLERALAVLNGCLRLARGRKWGGPAPASSTRRACARARSAALAAMMPPRGSRAGNACCSPIPRA
jgi:transposase